jgi:predicted outer membrane repeat protein
MTRTSYNFVLMTSVVGALAAASPARAAYFVPVSTRGQGSITNDGTCNLADAIDSANRQVDAHGCVSSGPDRTNIFLDTTWVNGAPPVYVLNSSQTITGTVYISAGDLPGDSVIQTGAANQMFLIKAGGSLFLSSGTWKRVSGTGRVVTNHGTFSTSASQVEGGKITTTCDGTSATGCGGGIFNDGVLFLGAIVTRNTADLGGGVYDRGADGSYGNSTISGNTARNGGGIYNRGNPSLYSVTIDGNTAVDGAGVYNDIHVAGTSAMHFDRCTISNNQATGNGGGIYTRDFIFVDTSTIARNSALNASSTGNGGGVYATPSSSSNNYLELYWSTVASNKSNCHSVNGACTSGAGVFVVGTMATKSGFCLFANNTRGSNNQRSDYFGDPHGGEHNSPTIGSFFSSFNDTVPNANDHQNTTTGLSTTLANNGGPTLTLKLSAGSPPTQTSLTGCGDTDQTFSPRPVGTGCDYGAFEAR